MLPEKQPRTPGITLFVIMYGILLFGLINLWGPIESSEARYAEIAREMIVSGDWIHPQFLNIHHYHKPPFTYWITAIGYKLFGINPAGFRFFLCVSLALQLLFVYRLALRLMNDKTIAITSTWIYGTLPLVIAASRGLTTDSYLNTFILMSIVSIVEWRHTQKSRWLYALAIAFGFGFLTKGPLILIVPVLFMIGFSRLLPRASFTWHHLAAILLFLVIGFSWYVALVVENHHFLPYFLFHQTYDRVANAEVFGRSEPFWYYMAYTPLTMLPWSVLLIAGFIRMKWMDVPPVLCRALIFLVLLPILFFSMVSSKLMLYVLPVFPAVAIIAAWVLQRIKSGAAVNWFLIYYIFIVLACYSVVFVDPAFHFSLLLWILPAIGLLALALLWRFFSGERTWLILYGSGVLTVFLLIFTALFMQRNELKVNGSKPIADWIVKAGLSSRPILIYNQLLPSLAFNLNERIVSLNDGNRSLRREVNFETNDRWRNVLYELTLQSEIDRLLPLLHQNPVLIVKDKIHEDSRWLSDHFSNSQDIGDWTIYY